MCRIISLVISVCISVELLGQLSTCDSLLFQEDFNTTMSNMVVAGWSGDFDETVLFDEGWTIASGPSTIGHTDSNDPTGPAGPYEGGNYIYYESSGPAPTMANGQITSPSIDIDASWENSTLSFYLFMHGADVGTFQVNAITPTSTDVLFTFSDEIQTAKSDSWEHVVVNLSPYIGQSIKIQFVGMKNTLDLGDTAIDLVQVCASAPTATIPTMTQWAISSLALLLFIIGVTTIKEDVMVFAHS